MTGKLHEDVFTFMIIYLRFVLKMRKFSNKSCRENQHTHFIFSNFFPKIIPFLRRCRKYGGAREFPTSYDDHLVLKILRLLKCFSTKGHDCGLNKSCQQYEANSTGRVKQSDQIVTSNQDY